MRHIKVKFSENEDRGKIVLKGNKIIVEANNKRTKEFLEGLIIAWRRREKLNDEKLFKIIPKITAHYSRMFFSNILNGEIEDVVVPEKKRSKADMERRRISDRSFKIWDEDGKLIAEMSEGKWIKKPPELEKK